MLYLDLENPDKIGLLRIPGRVGSGLAPNADPVQCSLIYQEDLLLDKCACALCTACSRAGEHSHGQPAPVVQIRLAAAADDSEVLPSPGQAFRQCRMQRRHGLQLERARRPAGVAWRRHRWACDWPQDAASKAAEKAHTITT